MHQTLALIFDFDDTLVPDSTTQFLKSKGIDTDKFWRQDAKALIERGYDPALAFLRLFLASVGPGMPLGLLKNGDLRSFGRQIDKTFYPGLPAIFGDLRAIVRQHRNISIEFYVISGGLQEMVQGSSIVRKNFTAVYGCQLDEDPDCGYVQYVKRCVTFTEKTRYLFEINKGLDPADTAKNPYLVNRDVPDTERAIPMSNMIYVGDGLTDVPCFSVVQKNKGIAFGVFDPKEEKSAKKALIEFLKPKRVIGTHAPRYGKHDELGALLRAAVTNRCIELSLARQQA